MGALFRGPPDIPPAPPPPPPAAAPPTLANPQVAGSAAMQRSRAAAAAGQGFGGTIANQGGAAGVQPAATAGKSLLGG
jgi:hypothetical protein